MTAPSTAAQEVGDAELATKSHLLPDDAKLIEATASILERHESVELEANIRAAIVHFLATTGLADRNDIKEEDDRIDIQSEHLIIETKQRIGTGIEPDQSHVSQLDGYIGEAKAAGKPDRLGVLTDGKHWVLRLPNIREVHTTPPYAFTLRNKDDGFRLYEWLQNETRIIEQSDRKPDEEEVRRSFGPGPRFENEIAALAKLYQDHRDSPTIAVKRQLWADLLTAALGISVAAEPDLDQLFLRHTYLSAIVGLAVQAAFGIDLREKSRLDAAKLLTGDAFRSETGVQGVIDSDFFAWPAEVGGEQWIVGLADRVARFDWADAEYDFARILYQSVVPAEDRRRLGEYYTPDWLAKAVVDEVVTDPLAQRVLDPSCGSGTFLYAAVQKYITAAKAANHPPERILDGLTQSVIGIDVHPVSVHLARATWVLAAREIIAEAGRDTLTVPVYLGDSLQLRTDSGSLFAQDHVSITVAAMQGEAERRLNFPKSLVAQPDWFDRVMISLSHAIASGQDPLTTLDDNDIPKGDPDRDLLEDTAKTLQDLHSEGRNHIWAYYTRNLVRPIWLSSNEGKVDAIVGNPPWLTYSKTDATIRSELERQSKNDYMIWVGGKFATHQDIAGLFYTRCVDLYLKSGGSAGMVLPHSALVAGQYEKWRSGNWGGVFADFSGKMSWDLEQIDPNTFFPAASCVIFTNRRKEHREHPRSFGENALCWLGKLEEIESGARKYREIVLANASSSEFASPYAEEARQGATIVPRLLHFVEVQESAVSLVKGIVKISPQRSSQEKKPWKNLQPAELINMSIEEEHIWNIHLGETIAPFVLLEPRKAVLPIRHGENLKEPKADEATICGINASAMGIRMRERWRIINDLWDENKSPNNKLELLGNLDYMGKLNSQLEVLDSIRLLYTTSGRPTAAVMHSPESAESKGNEPISVDNSSSGPNFSNEFSNQNNKEVVELSETHDFNTLSTTLVDTSLYWIICKTLEEAYYLAAVINSDTLAETVNKFTIPNWAGKTRHLHKHLWRLPIPTYDSNNTLHTDLAVLGSQLATEASTHLADLQAARASDNKSTSVIVARRQLRQWLSTHPPAQQVERLAARLIS